MQGQLAEVVNTLIMINSGCTGCIISWFFFREKQKIPMQYHEYFWFLIIRKFSGISKDFTKFSFD